MGNCMAGEVSSDAVRIMTETGGIMEIEGPVRVRTIVNDFPGYGIFRQGNVSSPLLWHEQLINGHLYYLVSARTTSKADVDAGVSRHIKKINGQNHQNLVSDVERELDVGLAKQMTPLRLSSGMASDLVANLTVGPTVEVLPSPGKGVWRVKMAINTNLLAEILSEDGNTEALIERMRSFASASGATPKRAKGNWGVAWKPSISKNIQEGL
ncbi:uncharacterized protein LOC143892021 [Tasmannia lanceolata]|uniref:uncharacterized protein LOC143892021 n=1 Tax=Tasmannia lanceolata TaxID=3420 RepID=UPI0040643334